MAKPRVSLWKREIEKVVDRQVWGVLGGPSFGRENNVVLFYVCGWKRI